MSLSKYQVVCATSESSGERPHRFFVWASSLDEAVFSECPVCGSEGMTATPCATPEENRKHYEENTDRWLSEAAEYRRKKLELTTTKSDTESKGERMVKE